MTQEAFQKQMNRLADTFGAQHYKPERLKIFWREMCALSDEWLERVVDRFIGYLRFPALLSEFSEEISRERERLWTIEKKRSQKEADRALSECYCSEKVSTVLKAIILNISHKDDSCMNRDGTISDSIDPPDTSLRAQI